MSSPKRPRLDQVSASIVQKLERDGGHKLDDEMVRMIEKVWGEKKKGK